MQSRRNYKLVRMDHTKTYLLLLVLCGAQGLSATVHQVGPTRTWISPNALYLANVAQNGDTVDIDAANYIGTAALAKWTAHNLLLRGVGGRPHLISNGQTLQGKAIWIIAGDNNRVENIEFSGAAVPDHNGAGIRQEGIGVSVRHCYFHDNEEGILTNNPGTGDIVIEYCEFNANSFGDGLSHNLYIGHVNSLTFRFNYSHHAKIGHNLKSRATNNYILYNRIMDEATGNSSRLIDLPNGGFSLIMGNLLMQGPFAENSNLVGYGLEGLSNPAPHELYFINNTCVNKRENSGIFLSIQSGTSVAQVINNIFTGDGVLVSGATTAMSNNIFEPDVATLQFVDEPAYDYHLTAGSPAVDLGTVVGPVGGISLTPDFSYLHPLDAEPRATANLVIDPGAYEYAPPSSSGEAPDDKWRIYPNPARVLIFIPEPFIGSDFRLYSSAGQAVLQGKLSETLPVADLPRGAYFLLVEGKSGRLVFEWVKW